MAKNATRPLPTLNPMAVIADVPPIRTPMTDGAIEVLAERLIMSHEAADRILMAVAAGSELTGAQITLLRSIGLCRQTTRLMKAKIIAIQPVINSAHGIINTIFLSNKSRNF